MSSPQTQPIQQPVISPQIAKPLEPIKPRIENIAEALEKGLTPEDIIAPSQIEVDFDYIKIGDVYIRTLFVSGYPRFVTPGWMEPVINFNHSLDIAFYIYPIDGRSVLDDLRRKITEMEAELSTDIQRGKLVNPTTEAKLEDAKMLQEQLVKGSERFFEFSFYITIPATSPEQLNSITKRVESTLGSILIVAKHAMLDHEKGFLSTIPFARDKLSITRNMDTTSLATTFPFTTAELSSDKGVLYGINSQNDSFIIFDRFSLENSNMAVFATSGAGKSQTYETPILYQDQKGNTQVGKIGQVVEQALKKGQVRQLAKEIEGVLLPNLKVFSFNKELKGTWSTVEIAARKVSPKTLYKITTQSGRSTVITKDHCLVTLKNAKISPIKGQDVRVGDYIPVPRKIKQQDSCQKTIQVVPILNKRRIKNYVVKHGRVGMPGCYAKTSVPTKIELNSNFFKLLGYFASEGMIRKERAFISSEVYKIQEAVKKYYSTLGISFGITKKHDKVVGVSIYSQLFIQFLKGIGASGKAKDKRVPPIVFQASDNHVAAFLQAYFDGDRGVEKHAISATTKSPGLASDLSYLLLRFGIIARIKPAKKAATNTLLKKKRVYYRISISGQDNIQKYNENIGFGINEKQKKAKMLLGKDNTNVDILPHLGTIFKEIYSELYNSEIPAPKKFSEIKLGMFRPSRKQLIKIIEGLETRIADIELLEKDCLLTLRQLPTIEDIIQKGNKKEINHLLWASLDASWHTMRKGTTPYLQNALHAIEVTHNQQYSLDAIGGAIYHSFKTSGVSLASYNKSLWDTIVNGNSNSRYDTIIQARDYILQKHLDKKHRLVYIKELVSTLKTLANSDLFWDPIIEIKKIKARHKYVYDIQVEDEVYLAGFGGMYVHNSFFVKLESLRSLMLDTQVIVIDPENEYQTLCNAVGGEWINFSASSKSKINPFDLAQVYEKGENQLGLKILGLHSLLKIIMGEITASQEALLDKAIINAYRAKGITPDPETQTKEPPLIEDLYKALIGMETKDALDLAARLEKFVRGSYTGIFDQQTNVSINSPFTVFSIRDVQDALRPIAMFIIIDYIWTQIRKDVRKRLLIVDEAWHMMRYADTAQFLWSIVKRARKYYLGLTTITQDVEDFLAQDIGKAVVTNSALRLLLKQSPAAIDRVAEIFYLSQGEKQLLLAANVGEGILFAGPHHAPIKIVASEEEYKLITTKPSETLEQRNIQPNQPTAPMQVNPTPLETVTIANLSPKQ